MDCYRLCLPSHLNPESMTVLINHQAMILNASPRLVLVTGEQDFFCQGLDFTSLAREGFQIDDEQMKGFVGFLDFLYSADFISIAVVAGKAIGGGVGIAAACDVVLAMDSSFFLLSEGLFGLTPGAILPYLSERLSRQTVKRMVFSAEPLSATEAKRLGLVDDIACDAEALEGLVKLWSKKLRRCHPQAVINTKSLLKQADTIRFDKKAAATLGIKLLCNQLAKPDIQEGLSNFIEYGLLPNLGQEHSHDRQS